MKRFCEETLFLFLPSTCFHLEFDIGDFYIIRQGVIDNFVQNKATGFLPAIASATQSLELKFQSKYKVIEIYIYEDPLTLLDFYAISGAILPSDRCKEANSYEWFDVYMPSYKHP